MILNSKPQWLQSARRTRQIQWQDYAVMIAHNRINMYRTEWEQLDASLCTSVHKIHTLLVSGREGGGGKKEAWHNLKRDKKRVGESGHRDGFEGTRRDLERVDVQMDLRQGNIFRCVLWTERTAFLFFTECFKTMMGLQTAQHCLGREREREEKRKREKVLVHKAYTFLTSAPNLLYWQWSSWTKSRFWHSCIVEKTEDHAKSVAGIPTLCSTPLLLGAGKTNCDHSRERSRWRDSEPAIDPRPSMWCAARRARRVLSHGRRASEKWTATGGCHDLTRRHGDRIFRKFCNHDDWCRKLASSGTSTGRRKKSHLLVLALLKIKVLRTIRVCGYTESFWQ